MFDSNGHQRLWPVFFSFFSLMVAVCVFFSVFFPPPSSFFSLLKSTQALNYCHARHHSRMAVELRNCVSSENL